MGTWKSLVACSWLAFECGCSTGEQPPAICACHHLAGASYQLTLTEQPGGACGPMSSQVLNVDLAGNTMNVDNCTSLTDYFETCQKISDNCLTSLSNGASCTVSSQFNFDCDGGSATGSQDFSCMLLDGGMCSSSYSVTAVLQ